mgnify:CR=1 FL=1
MWSDCDVSTIAEFNWTHTVIRLRRHAEPWRAFAAALAGAIFLALTHISSAQPIFKVSAGDGNLNVQAALNPRPAPDENLQLLLDGEPFSAPQRIVNWRPTVNR